MAEGTVAPLVETPPVAPALAPESSSPALASPTKRYEGSENKMQVFDQGLNGEVLAVPFVLRKGEQGVGGSKLALGVDAHDPNRVVMPDNVNTIDTSAVLHPVTLVGSETGLTDSTGKPVQKGEVLDLGTVKVKVEDYDPVKQEVVLVKQKQEVPAAPSLTTTPEDMLGGVAKSPDLLINAVPVPTPGGELDPKPVTEGGVAPVVPLAETPAAPSAFDSLQNTPMPTGLPPTGHDSLPSPRRDIDQPTPPRELSAMEQLQAAPMPEKLPTPGEQSAGIANWAEDVRKAPLERTPLTKKKEDIKNGPGWKRLVPLPLAFAGLLAIAPKAPAMPEAIGMPNDTLKPETAITSINTAPAAPELKTVQQGVPHLVEDKSSAMGWAQYELAKTTPEVKQALLEMGASASKDGKPVELSPSDPRVLAAVEKVKAELGPDGFNKAQEALMKSIEEYNPPGTLDRVDNTLKGGSFYSKSGEDVLAEVKRALQSGGVQ